jgi:hypothetical protein
LSGHILEHQSGTAYLPTEIIYREIPNVFTIDLRPEHNTLENPKNIHTSLRPQTFDLGQKTRILSLEMKTDGLMDALSEDEITRKQLQQMVGTFIIYDNS